MKLREGLVLRKIGGDYVIVDPGQGLVDLSKVYTLNETAAWLWEEVLGVEFSLEDLVIKVKDQYDVESVDESFLIADMQNLIKFLQDNNLLEA